MQTRSLFSSLLVLFLLGASTLAQVPKVVQETISTRPMTFEDMYSLGRVSDPQVSPDGRSILYVVTKYSLETNSSNSDIWLVDLKGGTPQRLTNSPKADHTPRWSPDGRIIAFISSRDGGPQIWLMTADGQDQKKLTHLSTGASGVEWSPAGTHLLFTSSVYPDCTTDACNEARTDAREKDPCKVKTMTRIPYRVWNAWKDDQFSHVFTIPVSGGIPRDVTPGEFDTPPIDLGGHRDYVLSPDGKTLAYVKNTDPIVAASTNNDIWLANLDGSEARCITTKNKGNDNNPVFSPDGRFIAYRSMARAGYEADKYDLKLYDRAKGTTVVLTTDFDRSVDEILWTPDGKRILFSAQDEAYVSLFEVSASGGDILRVLKGITTLTFREGGETSTLQLGTLRSSFSLLPDGKTLVFLGQRMNYPAEVMSAVYANGKVSDFTQITTTNAYLLDSLDMAPGESFTCASADGTTVQGWLVRPPRFDATKKYPMIFVVHGGPQGVWGDEFHYRWNLQLFAASGFVVVAVNPRGSTGFGQAYTDGVNGDWGGKPFQDLMAGLDYVLKAYPFIDRTRIGAAGASYGGYMMNWFLGHTDRFKAIFSHSGVYDLVSMYGGTEELWFPEWEFKGTPWSNPAMYEKWSPSRYAKNFRTPTLVSHGQLDFRVPVDQSIQLFNTLQRLGVESRFIYFPDEGHTILKPVNARRWYKEFADWFTTHLKP